MSFEKYYEFYKKISLLEIATIRKDTKFAKTNRQKVTGVFYKEAYATLLEKKWPFKDIKWDEKPFSDFRILKMHLLKI